jgi:UDP-2-acetamido-3-amino-2,3-dideoxy-glucuronate N-acetyltransferase
MPKTPSIAVIGSGYWGKNLVRNYHQLGALKLICDRNETLIGQFKRIQRRRSRAAIADRVAFTSSIIDAVVIAAPASTPTASTWARSGGRRTSSGPSPPTTSP